MQQHNFTTHGYALHEPNAYHKFPYLFCKDDADAVADIRELLALGMTIEVINAYDTFYGCSWGRYIFDRVKDIALVEVTASWNPGYYCDRPFPCNMVLQPKN